MTSPFGNGYAFPVQTSKRSWCRLVLLLMVLLQAWVPLVDAMSCPDCLNVLSGRGSHVHRAVLPAVGEAQSLPEGSPDLCPNGAECCPVCANASASFVAAPAVPMETVLFVHPETECTIVPGVRPPVFRPPKLS